MARRLLALALLLVAWVAARHASAGTLLIKPGGDVRVSDVRVAFSASSLRTVAWEQLVLEESRGELAWVVPVPRGGWIEPGDDHFFDSLDEATAPVIAPAKSLQCGTASESTAIPRGAYVRAVGSAIAPLSPTAAIDKLTALGFVVDPTTRASIAALDALGEDVAILILPAGTQGVTRVARVLGPSTRAFPATVLPATGARLHAFVMAPGRARFAGLPEKEVDSASLAWSGGQSNYGKLLDAAVSAAAPGAVTVFSSIDGVYVDQPGAWGTPIASLLRRYFAGEVSTPATADCVTRVAPLGFSAKTVAPTCAKSSAWTSGTTPPACAVATADQIPANDLVCGALDDLAAATSGHVPAKLVLTRLEAVAASAPHGQPLDLVALGSLPAFREAKSGPLCTDPRTDAGTPMPTGEPGPTQPPPSTNDDSSQPASSSSSDSSNGCSSTAQIFADSCSSGSDTGSDSGGCDSSSSSESCSSSSGGSSGCDCKGASDVADDGCRTARARPRIRVSAAAYLWIIAAAIARRWGRRSRTIDEERRCPETTSSSAPVRE